MTATTHQGKLSELLGKWPRGAVAVQTWLDGQGITRQHADGYCRHHWLRRIGRGAYARLNESVEWTGGLYAMQQQLKLPIHAGAKTALELQGYAHFLPLGKKAPVWLFGKEACMKNPCHPARFDQTAHQTRRHSRQKTSPTVRLLSKCFHTTGAPSSFSSNRSMC